MISGNVLSEKCLGNDYTRETNFTAVVESGSGIGLDNSLLTLAWK